MGADFADRRNIPGNEMHSFQTAIAWGFFLKEKKIA